MSKIDTLNKSFDNKYRIELAKLDETKALRDSTASAIKADRQKLNFEIFGNKTEETSGVMGYGPYAKRKEAELKRREQELDTLSANIAQQEKFVESRREFDGLRAEKMYTGRQLDSLANIAGFADRNWALGQLSFNPDGSRDVNTALAVTFIGLLFIFFECLPVFVKLMSERGPYDYAVENMETVQMHVSKTDIAYEIEVIDAVYDTRVTTETDRRKALIRLRAQQDLTKEEGDS
jgi:hypothetical protein